MSDAVEDAIEYEESGLMAEFGKVAELSSSQSDCSVDFSVFGAFEFRFEALFENAGKIRELIERSGADRGEEWKQELVKVIAALADAIGPLKET